MRNKNALLILMFAVALSGCMSFPHKSKDSKRLPELTGDGPKPSLSVRIRVQNHSATSGEAWVYDEPTAAEITIETLRETGLFSKVTEDEGSSDINADIVVDMHPSPSSYDVSVLAGLTLMAIPVWATNSMAISAELTLPGQRKTSNYRFRGKSTDVMWLPLLIGSPFKTIWSAKRRLLKEALQSVAATMQADGLLKIDDEAPESAPAAAVTSDVDKPTYRQTSDPNKFAVVVGVEKYTKDLPSAQFAERDALAIREHLLALGYPLRNIVLLTGVQATKSGIAKHLGTWLPRNVGPESEVLFYFSGHGAPEPTGTQAYIVPFDGDPEYLADSAYSTKEIQSQLSALKAKRVIAILDTCFSGTGDRSLLAKGTRPLVASVDLGPTAANKLAVITAATANQISGVSQEQGHGLFTYYLLRGLNGAAKDGRGRITIKSILDYVSPNVQDEARRNNRTQTPQLLSGLSPEQAELPLR